MCIAFATVPRIWLFANHVGRTCLRLLQCAVVWCSFPLVDQALCQVAPVTLATAMPSHVLLELSLF